MRVCPRYLLLLWSVRASSAFFAMPWALLSNLFLVSNIFLRPLVIRVTFNGDSFLRWCLVVALSGFTRPLWRGVDKVGGVR